MATAIEAGLEALVDVLPTYKVDDSFFNKGDNNMEVKKEGLNVEGEIRIKDMVNHPRHYNAPNGLEVIDVIEAFTEGLEGIEATDTGNVIKYICRWHQKNGVEDLRKIVWYTNHLINHLENKNNKLDITIEGVDASRKLKIDKSSDSWCRNPFIPENANDAIKYADELCKKYDISFGYRLTADKIIITYGCEFFKLGVYNFELVKLNKMDIANSVIDFLFRK